MTCNIIINRIFSEMSLKFLKSFRRYKEFLCQYQLFSLILIVFLDFLTFPCYKETNDVSVQQIMSPFFHFQHTLNRLFNICMELYWYYISSSWNINETVGERGGDPPEKTTLRKPSLIRVKTHSENFYRWVYHSKLFFLILNVLM